MLAQQATESASITTGSGDNQARAGMADGKRREIWSIFKASSANTA
jgi:hypothetical protein